MRKLTVVLLFLGSALSAKLGVTPMQKVTQMLQDIVAEATEDKLLLEEAALNEEMKETQAALAEVSASIREIDRAIQVLKQKSVDLPQSLPEVQDSELIPDRAKAAITSYLAAAQNMESDEFAPEANTYEHHPGSVILLLEKLLAKFEDQKLTLEKEEMTSVGNFQVLEQNLTDNIKDNKKSIGEKTKMKAQRLEDEETALGDKETTEAALATDSKVLTDTNADCMAASDEFEKNQVMRSEEIKALETAIGILSSDAVAGNAAKHLPALAQESASSFAQLRSSANTDPEIRNRVAQFLQSKAKKLNSRYLALVATRAEADPFVKVKKMIKDMIVKLMEEANSEADHKAYCDTEMATNKMTRDNKQAEVDELTAAVEEHTAAAAQLATQIKELSDEIADIKAKQVSYTSLRNEEKEVNTVAIEDAKVAQAAVAKATQVLKDFYGKASEGSSASLLQDSAGIAQEMAQAAKAPYTGMQSASGGVMGFLDVILSDFARLQTETEMAENTAQSEYEKFMDESTEDAEVKGTEMDHKEKKKISTDEANRALKKELKLTQEELDKALDYYDKLKPDCVDQGLSYEDRVAMRKEEIVSLQEALKILTGEDIA
eukprot:gnl/TRDRNA2_/TRDRNA2_177938_c1_seq59.p1 gnl/TRDRNA2_/TRDRNA2_177938_c1~~gnl/TRDRNA2_/TRDRNA2_177938_c1_seq59.p1  ORF type:complete len:605 (-),score=222.40 gnl/TRDRNA2_/TRDRNA2_177938_c1_seq59:100-1914(-)